MSASPRGYGPVLAEALALLAVLAWCLWRVLGRPVREAAEAGVDPVGFLSGEGGRLVGAGVDLAGTLWTFDHVHQRLVEGVPLSEPVATLFLPEGLDLARAQGMAWADAVLAAPLLHLLGTPGFYNLHVVLTLAGSFLGAWLVLRLAGSPPAWALALAGTVVVNPFVIRELFEGRPTQVHLLFHCLFLAALLALIQRRLPAVVAGVLGGLALAAACLVYWFSGAAVGLLGALVLAVEVVLSRRRDLLLGGLALAATALGACAFVAAPVLGELVRPEHLGRVAELGPLQVRLAVDPVAHAGPAEVLRTLSDLGLGIPLLLGALAALAPTPARRTALPWVLGGLACASLVFGPLLQVGERWIPTLSALVDPVWPAMVRCRQPGRLVVAGLLGLSLALGLGAAGLRERLGGGPRGRLLLGLGALAWLLGLGGQARVDGVRALSQPLSGSAFYERLARDTPPGAILDVPLARSSGEYVYQLVHGRPLVGGMGFSAAGVRSAGHGAWTEGNSVVRHLHALAEGHPAGPWTEGDLEELLGAGVELVVLHGRSPGRLRAFREALGKPVVAGRIRRAYSLRSLGSGEVPLATSTAAAPD